MAAWNVLSLRDDDHLPLLSRELGRLGVVIAALSEVRRPKSGEISVGGYTYYWSGRSDGYHSEGVAVAISGRLAQMVVEAVPVNERMMRLRVKHSLGVISVVSVYAPTGVSSPSDKDTFYAQLESVLDGCPRGDSLLVMGDFNASTGTDRAGYETCIGPHGSGIRGQNGTRLLDLARGRGLRVAGSWYQRPERHRLDLVFQHRRCCEGDRSCTRGWSLEDSAELPGFPERAVPQYRSSFACCNSSSAAQVQEAGSV